VSIEQCCNSALAGLALYNSSSKSWISRTGYKGVYILVRASSLNKNSKNDCQ
jgi:hypothetical protein